MQLFASITTMTTVDDKLLKAFQRGDLDEVERLVTMMNHKLLNAVERGRLDGVKRLIKWGTSVSFQDENGRTALFYASESGRADIVRFLIDLGANLNTVDSNGGSTPLHISIQRGYTEVTLILLENGANLAIKNKDGKTPLEIAGSPHIVLALARRAVTIHNKSLVQRTATTNANVRELIPGNARKARNTAASKKAAKGVSVLPNKVYPAPCKIIAQKVVVLPNRVYPATSKKPPKMLLCCQTEWS
jgi:hypothetical protein